MPNIEPIQPTFRLEVLSVGQLEAMKSATFHILENVGVRFPSQRALNTFREHGAMVDQDSQSVRLPPDLVLEAMSHAPRSYVLAGRVEGTDLLLDGTCSYFSTDGCGVETIDLETGEHRTSRKQDVATMARVADYLPSIAFYWPMVSAQEYGRIAPLHELEASYNNTVKHVQTETVMGERLARYAVRMAEVIAGDKETMRTRPPLSSLICTITPLGQDTAGIEAAMVFAEEGIPVGFMAMPTMGSTAPATPGGALVLGNAEVVSAMVLMQLVAAGVPVYHSIIASVMDPRTADYVVSLPEKYLCNAAAVQIAHDWGVPALAGVFGMGNSESTTWQHGRDSVYSALMCSLAGAEMASGLGLLRASTLLLPEQIIFDDEIYHTHRILGQGIEVGTEALAADVVTEVGPGGHFLGQRHTRQRLRERWIPELTHPRPSLEDKPAGDVRRRARARLDRILAEHQPEPLDDAARSELRAILDAAAQELST
ncbi:MAG: trimethylamine methyltransferase family protein [Anaerolineae bacterium]